MPGTDAYYSVLLAGGLFKFAAAARELAGRSCIDDRVSFFVASRSGGGEQRGILELLLQ